MSCWVTYWTWSSDCHTWLRQSGREAQAEGSWENRAGSSSLRHLPGSLTHSTTLNWARASMGGGGLVPLACVALASTKQSRWSSSLDLWSKLVLRGSMERAFLFLSNASEMHQQHTASEQVRDRTEGLQIWAARVQPAEGASFTPRQLLHHTVWYVFIKHTKCLC